jgi:hypothetical protein
MGHEERFPPTRLSAGCGFRKETVAGMRRNGRDAPIPAIHEPAMEPPESTSAATIRGLFDRPVLDSVPCESEGSTGSANGDPVRRIHYQFRKCG